jgi:uncharacterized protein with ACT and thioredoxin-like domain
MLEQKVTEFRSVAAKAAEKEGKDDAFVNKAMQRLVISASELAGKEVVGKGAFGEVYRSDYRGATVAVKTVKVISEENLDRFQKEILLMGDLRHQNIVTLIGAVWEKDLMGLVMEVSSARPPSPSVFSFTFVFVSLLLLLLLSRSSAKRERRRTS